MNNGKPRECLFISCISADPFSTLLLNPMTGTSVWSFRGAELRGGISGIVEPIGRDVSHLCVPIANKQLIYITTLNSKNGQFASISRPPGIVRCLASHHAGHFLFGAIENRIFTWAIPSGELLSVASDSLQEISVLKLSACGSYLVAGVGDGNVKLYTLHSLVERRNHDIEPVRAFRNIAAHSLRVTDLHVSGSNQPRVLSVSLDHTVVLSSAGVLEPLLKICVDQPVTACCMDPAETRLIIGLKTGLIAIINLYDYTPECDVGVLKVGKDGEADGTPFGLRILEHHSSEVCRLCVNADAHLFASGDTAGGYCIWDLQSGQCLKASTMKGPISTLRFTEYWPQLEAEQKKAPRTRHLVLVPAMGELKAALVAVRPPAEALTKVLKTGRQPRINEFLYGQFEEILQIVAAETAPPTDDEPVVSLFGDDPQPAAAAEKAETTLAGDENEIEKAVQVVDNIEILEQSTDPNQAAASVPPSRPQAAGGRAASTRQAERIRELERELRRIRKVNQELYENAAKLLSHTDI